MAAGARQTIAARVVDIERAKADREKRAGLIATAAREVVTRIEIGSRAVELLDSIQINGKKLGDCTRSEIVAEADRDARRSDALAQRARWLRSIADILDANQTVRDADRRAVLAALQDAP